MSEMAILDESLRLSPSVKLRPEPFGALAYHFGTRQLTFLKRPELVAVVEGLDGSRSLREVLAERGVPTSQWPVYAATIERLLTTDMVCRP